MAIRFLHILPFLLLPGLPTDAVYAQELIQGQEDGSMALNKVSEEKMSEFYDALENIFPMTPEMVDKFLGTYYENEFTVSKRPEPNPLIDFQLVSLEPGREPPVVRVTPGIASAVGFFDATGTPWPVNQFVVGDGTNFEILQLGDQSNSLTISPLARVGQTNLVIALKGEATPLVLKVEISSETVHYQVNFQITRPGPEARISNPDPADHFPMPGNQDLLKALAGSFSEEEASRVELDGINATGWIKGEELFIRSRHVLLSPPWLGSLTGPDGVVSYQLPYTSILLFSVGDRVVKIALGHLRKSEQ
ncbi:MAG: hypothetical protein OXC82_12900 [Rhodobacteraceae bacterium]|nr:hypothetical protein [Paracoccaceae bacterium]MCY4251317.1 hypothetical protein [Paracoccaceae bacterium]